MTIVGATVRSPWRAQLAARGRRSLPLPLGEGWPKARVRAVRTLFIEKAQPR